MTYDIVILGAGESGTGAALLAKKQKLSVFVSDKNIIKDEYKTLLRQNNIPFEENKHSEDIILSAKKIVKSPGIPDNNPLILKALKKNISVISEIEFAYEYHRGKIIAITGSNGKTTTTALTFSVFDRAFDNYVLAGNIGYSYAKAVAENPENNAVLEISSFQLDGIKSFKPASAAILNITPDHLDRYGYKLENYVKSKFRIALNQTADDFLILNFDDENIANYLKHNTIQSQILFFSLNSDKAAIFFDRQKSKIISPLFDFEFDTSGLKIKGKHNILNAMAAVLLAKTQNIDNQTIIKVLQDFEPIEHRLQPVRTVNGVRFINDSKATNVESVWYALDSLPPNIILILGGIDKGNDYEKIRNLVREKVKRIIALGVDNKRIVDFFSEIVPVVEAKSMAEAVRFSYDLAKPGDIVLLSPACASFDLFQNYIDRGNQFIKYVNSL